MKTKLFFLTLLLNLTTAALHAAPMWEEPTTERQTDRQQEIQQHNRDAVGTDGNPTGLDDRRGTELPNEQIDITETEMLETDSEAIKSLTKSLKNTYELLKIVTHDNDPNAPKWKRISLNITEMKKSIQDFISPPSPSILDTCLGRLPKISTPQEIEGAKIIQPAVLALESALLVRKQDAISKNTIKKAVKRQKEGPIFCWPFASTDPNVEVFQKLVEVEKAWKLARDNFYNHIEQLPEDLKKDILSLDLEHGTNSEITNPIALAWFDACNRIKLIGVLTIPQEMKGMLPETIGKIFIQETELLECRDKANDAMLDYDKNPNEDLFNLFSKAIDELAASIQKTNEVILIEDLSEEYKQTFENMIERLTYLKTVYYCSLHMIKFWDYYEKTRDNNIILSEEERQKQLAEMRIQERKLLIF